jgi:hypothetical protein
MSAFHVIVIALQRHRPLCGTPDACEGIGSFAILDNGFKNLKNPGASNSGERGISCPSVWSIILRKE